MPTTQSDDRAAIQSILDEEDAAWAAGDAAAFSRSVAPQVVFTNIFGQQIVGKAGFEAQHAAIFATIYKSSRLKQTIAHIRFVAPDVALVDSDCTVSGPAIPPPLRGADGGLHARLLQVFVKKAGGWMIESYHNVRVAPPPGA